MARNPAYRKTHEQIREHLLAGGAPCPICGGPMTRQHRPGPHHPDTAGR